MTCLESKINNANKSTWLKDGYTEEEFEEIKRKSLKEADRELHKFEADPKGYKTFILDEPTGFEVLK